MFWLNPRNFSRAERIIVPVVGFLPAALSLIPYFVLWFQTPVHRVYLWSSTFYFDDYFQYYAWANRAAAGDWLIRNYYTHDPATSFALFNPFFLLLGWLTRLSGNVCFAYHAFRFLLIVPFICIAYAFNALFLEQPRSRIIAALLLLGGGLEYPFYYVAAWAGAERFPTPLADPYVFKVLYRYGHLTACLMFLLVAFGSYWSQTRRARHPLNLLALALAVLLIGLINPYYIVLVGGVLAADALTLLCRRQTAGILPLAIAGAAALLAALQYMGQPITSQLGDIAFDDPIGLLDLALFTGILLPFAVLGFSRTRREGRDLSFFLIWIVVVLLLVLSPLRFRARMVFGLQFALAIPCALWFAQRAALHWTRIPLWLLLLVEPSLTFIKEGYDFHHRGIGTAERSFMEALDELNKRARPGDVIVSAPLDGILIPAFTRASVYIGHSFQTPGYYKKREMMNRFYIDMPPEERAAFLREISADLILTPPMNDFYAGAFQIPGWHVVYEKSGYRILTP